MLRHPEWAKRDCDDCQTYRFEGGKVARDQRGMPVISHRPITCARVPCKCPWPHQKPQLDAAGLMVYRRFRDFRLLGVLPKSGGLDDQNWIEREVFVELRKVEESWESEQRSKAAAKMGPMAYLLFPPSSR